MKRAMSKRVIALVVVASMVGPTTVHAVEIKKDESVYVNLEADGRFEKATVSDWIHSDVSGKTVFDKSELNNIKNVKSDVEPDQNGENLMWNMEGSDLYYQGTTNKELPIDVDVKYYYEDSEIDPEDLAGKSGKVKIAIKITNKEFEEVEVNGKKRNIYTPFVVAGEITFPNDKFSNVTTDGGTILSEGNNNIVAFTKAPGLKDSLELDSIPFEQDSEKTEKINELMDGEVVVEADVKEFSLGPIMMTAVSDSSVFDDLDTAVDLNEYRDMLSELKDNYDKIIDGSTQLSDGVAKGYEAVEEGLLKVKQPKFARKISLITDDYNVNRSNKLLDDADFAIKMDTNGMDILLNELQANSGKIDKLISNKDTSIGRLKTAGATLSNAQIFLASGDNAQKLMKLQNDMLSMKANYDKLDDNAKIYTKTTVENLNKLLSGITVDDLNKSIAELNLTIGNVQKLTPLQEALKKQIVATEITDANIKNGIKNPNDMTQIVNAKTQQFLLNLSNSVNALKNLQNFSLSIPKGFKLSEFADDVNSYGKAYMVLRMELLAAGMQNPSNSAGAISAKKAQLSAIADQMLAKDPTASAMIKEFINNDLSENLTAEGLVADKTKLLNYSKIFNEKSLASLSSSIAALKQMESLLAMTDLLENQETKAAVLSLLNQNTSSLDNLSNMLEKLSSLTKEEQESILNLTKSLSKTAYDVTNNMEIINSIQKLIGDKKLDEDSLKKFNNFASEMKEAEESLSALGQISLPSLDSSKIDEAKKLLDMQNDLKNSQDILRILRESLDQNEVNEARNLIATLPSYTSKLTDLKEGSQKLTDGINEYGEKAIDKLYDKGNDGLTSVDELSEVKDHITESAKNYGCFSGKDDSMKGSTKFIMKTKEIEYEAPKDDDSKEVKEEKKGFFAWLKSLIGLE